MATDISNYISKEYQGKLAIGAPAAVSKATSAAAWDVGVVTITSAAHGFVAGDVVTTAALAPAELNGSFTVLSATTNDFTYELVADPGPVTDGVGTVEFTTPEFKVGMVITGGTSAGTAVVKESEGAGASTVLTFDTIGGTGLFADAETITGRNVTAVVDTVADSGSFVLNGTSIHLTESGIERHTVTAGGRTLKEVLVASRQLATKQAA